MYLNWVTICLSKHRSKLNFLILFLEISKFVWGKMESKSVVLKQGAYMLNDQNYYENVLNMTRVFEIEVIRPISIFVVSIDAPSSGNKYLKTSCFFIITAEVPEKILSWTVGGLRVEKVENHCSKPHEKVDHIYIHAFSKRFYPKRLTVHLGYTFFVSVFPGNWTHCHLRC